MLQLIYGAIDNDSVNKTCRGSIEIQCIPLQLGLVYPPRIWDLIFTQTETEVYTFSSSIMSHYVVQNKCHITCFVDMYIEGINVKGLHLLSIFNIT